MMDSQSRDFTIYSLSQLAESLRFAIYRTFPDQVWVQAEITKLNIYPRSGHVYLDLVEKEDGVTKAQMRGIIWANDFPDIREKFERVTKESFQEGLKILFLARFNFHATYGLSLWISDVEPSFTLGELSRIKTLTIEQLSRENLFDLNKQLPVPTLPLRIAVISAETSKGYLDFLQVIRNHHVPYRFEITLFPALLQGDKAVDSIRGQLISIATFNDEIQRSRIPDPGSQTQNREPGIGYPASCFDLVAIIRGGGDEIGLTCFDNYELARDICTFPLPVVTGIGHSTNETVVEMVAALNRITPTEVAYDLLARLDKVYEKLLEAETDLRDLVKELFYNEQNKLLHLSEALTAITSAFIRRQQSDLEHQGKTLRLLATHIFSSQKAYLSTLEGEIRHLDPKQVLRRGFSMTYDLHGRILKEASDVSAGERILTELASGTIKSTVDT
ncbi:MAG: exodeoxyribonuclease VII large subunit [Bacteroidota bacterium]